MCLFQLWFSQGICQIVGLLGNMEVSFLIFKIISILFSGASLVAQMVKNLPAMRETHVRSLSQEDSLEKGMVIHSSIVDNKLLYYRKCKLSFF